MTSEKNDAAKTGNETYEAPRVVDYGDLAELTAGGFIRLGYDQLWPNSQKAQKGWPSFS